MTNENDRIELLTNVYNSQQTLISNADSKANIALSIQTFITTTVLSAAIIVGAFNKADHFTNALQLAFYILFALFIISSITGLALCVNVFKPRPPQEDKELKRKGITYFGHIKKFKNSKEYLEEINETKPNDIIRELAFQNYSLALILAHKMKFVKHSTTFLFFNILLGIALLLFSLAAK